MNDVKTGIDKVVQVFSWLAKKKSLIITGTSDYIERNIWCDGNLSDSDKMLLHWLVYITDRGKNADMLWPKNIPILKEVISNSNKIFSNQKIENVKDFTLAWEINGLFMKQKKIAAFPSDVEAIKKTIYLLQLLEMDFIEFLKNHLNYIKKNGSDDVLFQNIASALNLLSYTNTSMKSDGHDGYWGDDYLSLKEYSYFSNKKSEVYQKRIWAAIRDYSEREMINNPFNDIPNELKKHILIPGDQWNKEFYENFLKDLIENKTDEKNYLELIRKEFEKRGGSPVDYDISFGFARKMCKGRLCRVCIFGNKSKIKYLCLENIESCEDKYCPVAMIIYDSYILCEGKNCKIKDMLNVSGPCKMPKIND